MLLVQYGFVSFNVYVHTASRGNLCHKPVELTARNQGMRGLN